MVIALNEVGCLISFQEHIVYILSSLGAEYDSIVYAISVKTKTKPLQEIVSLLMNHENQLERNLLVNVDGIQLVANLVLGNVDKKQNTSNIDKRNQRQPQWNNQ